MIDENGGRTKKPSVSIGRKTSHNISVNPGLAAIAGILATTTGKSRNKVMSILVSRCLYDALRDMRIELQKCSRKKML